MVTSPIIEQLISAVLEGRAEAGASENPISDQ